MNLKICAMKLSLNRILIIVLLILSTSYLHSKDNTSGDTIKKNTYFASSENTSENYLSNSDAYKLLYENEVKNGERLISTIQWVIGIAIAFLLAIIGSQIFFNYRINKREIDYIRKDLGEYLANLNSENIKHIDDKNDTNKKMLEQSISKLEKDLKDNLKEDFEKKSKFLELDNKFFVLETKREIKELKAEIEKNSGDMWLLKGIDSNALTSFVRTALVQIELKKEVKYILDDIIDILSKLKDLSEYDSEQITELLSKIPSSNKTKKDKIHEITKDMPVYKWVENAYQNDPSSLLGLSAGTGLSRSPIFGMNIPMKKYIKNIPKKEK